MSTILTHGSDLTLAPTVRPVVRQLDGRLRTALERLAEAGCRAVQLDATLAGLRPRDLDASGRRDLRSLVVRRGMLLSGLDLFIPRRHFIEAEHQDRACAAVLAAIELAADMGKVPVSLGLPVQALSGDVRKALVEAADGRGVRLAVHAEDQLDALDAWLKEVDAHALGVGLDPAALLAAGKLPQDLVHRFSPRLASARLSDFLASGGGSAEDDAPVGGFRCVPGEGDLDLIPYRVALDLAKGRGGPVVLDLRGLENPLSALAQAQRRWDKAAFSL